MKIGKPGSAPSGRTPQWVKVVGAAVAVAILLIVVLTLLPGGDHGPGRH